MEKTAFIFPGQGSQYVGMCKGYSDLYTAAEETFEEANEHLGYDIKRITFEGPAELLDSTENTQPALLASSIAVLRVLRQRLDIEPAFVAGHSLGEYTALVAAGAMDFGDALKIVHLRGRFMQEGVPEGTGRMCAVIGLGIDVVAGVCTAVSNERMIVVPANINSPEQIVISGHARAVDRAARVLKEKGASRVVPLKVSAPSHSPLMKAASERLGKELERIEVHELRVPVVTNVEAEPLTDSRRVVDLLVRQLVSPVRWVDIVRRLRKEGVSRLFEVGPGRVLSGLVRRIEKDMKAVSLDDPSAIDSVLDAVKGG